MISGGQWPRWATVRAKEVRTLPSEEWGAWAQGGDCSRGTPAVWGLPDTGHPAEAPFFFHCLSCIAAVHRGSPPPALNDRRDKGLCIRCGEPAEHLRDRMFTPSAACQQAEAKGITVARLSTRKFCAECDPFSKPMCRGRGCPDKAKPHRSILTCKNTIGTHSTPLRRRVCPEKGRWMRRSKRLRYKAKKLTAYTGAAARGFKPSPSTVPFDRDRDGFDDDASTVTQPAETTQTALRAKGVRLVRLALPLQRSQSVPSTVETPIERAAYIQRRKKLTGES